MTTSKLKKYRKKIKTNWKLVKSLFLNLMITEPITLIAGGCCIHCMVRIRALDFSNRADSQF